METVVLGIGKLARVLGPALVVVSVVVLMYSFLAPHPVVDAGRWLMLMAAGSIAWVYATNSIAPLWIAGVACSVGLAFEIAYGRGDSRFFDTVMLLMFFFAASARLAASFKSEP